MKSALQAALFVFACGLLVWILAYCMSTGKDSKRYLQREAYYTGCLNGGGDFSFCADATNKYMDLFP